jgi:putative ABC transport system permease protein
MALPIVYNVRSLAQRWKVTLLAVFGIALVVAVFVTLLAMEAGFRISLRSTGSPLNGIVTQRGSQSELTSWMQIGDANVIMVDPRVARNAEGKPMASCEVVVLTSRPKRADNQPANITFRGVSPIGMQVRNGIKISEGRMFTPGLYEVIAGKKIADRVTGLDVGSTISIQKKDWKIVGQYVADGSSFESEIWGDYDAMAPAIGRNGGCESLTVRLQDPKTLPAFDKELRANPRVQLQIDSEPKYYENLAGATAQALLFLAGFVSIVMGIGAVFGAMNTLYAIVAQRTREIGVRSDLLRVKWVAIVGGPLGILLSVALGLGAGAVLAWFAVKLAHSYLFGVEAHDAVTFAAVIALLTFAALLAAWLPARRAASVDPILALRSE